MNEYRIPTDIANTLFNWARWARVRRWQPSSCRSIEGRYMPELGEVWDDSPPKWPVDMLEAWHVEQTWRTRLPFKERMVVRSFFITAPVTTKEGRNGDAFRFHIYRTCRQLGIRFKAYPNEVNRAALMLRNALHGQQKGF